MPAKGEILKAAGGGFFLVFTWALRGFFYQLASLILYHPLGELFAILAYVLALALLETLAALGFLLLLSMILPAGWLRSGFGTKAFLALLIGGIAAAALEGYLSHTENAAALPVLAGLLITLGLLAAAILWVQRSPRLHHLLEGLLDRLSIFNWVYLPFGLIGLLVVIFRNLA